MEILDIVDEAGLPTGETIVRSDAHARGICHRTAHIWIARQIPVVSSDPQSASSRTDSVPSDPSPAEASSTYSSVSGKSAANSRWQVLLQKRAMTKESFPGCYDTSSAGHIQAGDEPLESALRELEEELGIQAAPEELAFMGNARIRYEKEFHGQMFRDNEVVFLYLYTKPVDIETLHLQTEELDSVRWFDLDEVIRSCRNHDPAFCVPSCGLAVVQKHLES